MSLSKGAKTRGLPGPMAAAAPERLWAVVLAGGEGLRLRPLTRRACGDERPKQFVPLLGSRSLLGQTLDRVARLVPRERTVVVAQEGHARYLRAEFSDAPVPRLLLQPENRGTAAGVLWPIHWIERRDPEAVVAVFPADHFVLDEAIFMAAVGEAAEAVRCDPRWIVLLGAPPTDPEPGYGWIEPGEPVGSMGAERLDGVRRFVEKPSPEGARACLEAGWLWNTLVLVGRASALIEAGRQTLPEVHRRLTQITALAGTPAEGWAIRRGYALMAPADFSRTVLAERPSLLAVYRMPPVGWCDLGTPARALKTLARFGLSPGWLAAGGRPA